MTTIEREALAAISLMAALVDGVRSDAEREKLRQSIERIGNVSDDAYNRVVAHRTSLEDEARNINDPESRRLAYELAVGVCAADGVTSKPEQEFLDRLAGLLSISPDSAKAAVKEGNEFADIKLDAPAAAAAVASVSSPVPAPQSKSQAQQADDTIMTYAAINAGLELLPQRLAGVAVIPLQAKMVHKIGTIYGYKLDSGHIKEFIAAAGVGMTSQVVESFARRFLGNLAGRYMGGTARTITEKATGPLMTFATTYALGHVAKTYYAGGRKLTLSDLQRMFSSKVEEAKGVYASNEGSILDSARKLDPSRIMSILRGA
ncbi:MAG: TerB family tellurite resistance protein [Phycisphaerales bacterium]